MHISLFCSVIINANIPLLRKFNAGHLGKGPAGAATQPHFCSDVVECIRFADRARFLVLRLLFIEPPENVRATRRSDAKNKVMGGDKGLFWLSFDEAWRDNPVFRAKPMGAADSCEA